MPFDPAKNFAIVTVSTGYDAAATSVALTAGHGARLPDTATEGEFNLVWWNYTDYPNPADDPNAEIVRVTDNSTTDTLDTIVRAQEGTSASTKNTGGKTYKMMLAFTKEAHDRINDELPMFVRDENGDWQSNGLGMANDHDFERDENGDIHVKPEKLYPSGMSPNEAVRLLTGGVDASEQHYHAPYDSQDLKPASRLPIEFILRWSDAAFGGSSTVASALDGLVYVFGNATTENASAAVPLFKNNGTALTSTLLPFAGISIKFYAKFSSAGAGNRSSNVGLAASGAGDIQDENDPPQTTANTVMLSCRAGTSLDFVTSVTTTEEITAIESYCTITEWNKYEIVLTQGYGIELYVNDVLRATHSTSYVVNFASYPVFAAAGCANGSPTGQGGVMVTNPVVKIWA